MRAPQAADAPLSAASPAPALAPAPDITAEELAARAGVREAEVARLMGAARPYVRGARIARVRLDRGAAVAPVPAEEAAWKKITARLGPRLGGLEPLTPLAVELAQTPEYPGAAVADALRRAGAMMQLEYLLIYTLTPHPKRDGGIFARRWTAVAAVEATLLDVRTGAIAASAAARFETPASHETEASARSAAEAGAIEALGTELDAMARALDAQAMRAAGPMQ